jgi:hypothetical protein
MANAQLGVVRGVVDKRQVQVGPTPLLTQAIATPANYASVSTLRTRLNAIGAPYTTASYLDAMTVNDMVYALRVSDDAAGI